MLAIDLFAGAGGLSLGLRRTGFDVICAVELDASASTTYRRNLGNHVASVDITTLSPRALRRRLGLDVGELDLIAGGPPCQGFSIQRRGGAQDQRNSLIHRFAQYVHEFKPRAFLLENVPGLAFSRHRELFDALLADTIASGYTVSDNVVNALAVGVAQERTRLFIIGLRGGITPITLPTPRSRIRTVRDAIGDLPSPPADGSCHSDFKNHFREKRLSERNIERLQFIPMGGGREDLPLVLQLPCHRRNAAHRHLDVYGRLHWDKPSGTITARFDSFTRGRFAHPVENRSLTIREGARLQGFPDDFEFIGSREQTAMQVGNAVPPRLAEFVSRAIHRRLIPRKLARR